MSQHVKPIVVISKCLEFAACRYDGGIVKTQVVNELKPFVEFIPICPEVAIGLPIPRDPIIIVQNGEQVRLMQPSTDWDLTEEMKVWAADYLAQLGHVDGFVLKSRSPSCGINDCKLFAAATAQEPIGTISGFFAAQIQARFPHAVLVSERDLEDPEKRQEFLQRIYASALQRVDKSNYLTLSL